MNAFYALSSVNLAIPELLQYGFLFVIISGAALFDIYHQLIPNRLIIAGILGWVFFLLWGTIPVLESLLAGICVSSIFLLIRKLGTWLYKKAGMGMGDIKLVLVIGLFIQWDVLWASYLAILTGGLWAAAGLGLKRLNKESRLPFGPFLWLGSVLAIFFIPFQSILVLWR